MMNDKAKKWRQRARLHTVHTYRRMLVLEGGEGGDSDGDGLRGSAEREKETFMNGDA